MAQGLPHGANKQLPRIHPWSQPNETTPNRGWPLKEWGNIDREWGDIDRERQISNGGIFPGDIDRESAHTSRTRHTREQRRSAEQAIRTLLDLGSSDERSLWLSSFGPAWRGLHRRAVLVSVAMGVFCHFSPGFIPALHAGLVIGSRPQCWHVSLTVGTAKLFHGEAGGDNTD